MQAYINQLLEDMMAAQRCTEEKKDRPRPISIEEHFEEIERWIASEAPRHTFSYYCGLTLQQFPPAEYLNNEQLGMLCKGFRDLLFSWNLDTDVPESMPLKLAYPFMISALAEKVDIVDDGIIGIEFCTCDPPSCPFKEYCCCIKYFSDADNARDDLEQEGEEEHSH